MKYRIEYNSGEGWKYLPIYPKWRWVGHWYIWRAQRVPAQKDYAFRMVSRT